MRWIVLGSIFEACSFYLVHTLCNMSNSAGHVINIARKIKQLKVRVRLQNGRTNFCTQIFMIKYPFDWAKRSKISCFRVYLFPLLVAFTLKHEQLLVIWSLKIREQINSIYVADSKWPFEFFWIMSIIFLCLIVIINYLH